MDPCYKLARLKFFIQEFHKIMAYDSDISGLNYDVRRYLDLMYATYEK